VLVDQVFIVFSRVFLRNFVMAFVTLIDTIVC